MSYFLKDTIMPPKTHGLRNVALHYQTSPWCTLGVLPLCTDVRAFNVF